MNFWSFNLFCFICQRVFDPQCNNIILQSNMSFGFIVPDNKTFELDNCYFRNINLLEEKDIVSKKIIKYNYNENIEEIVDYIENEIALEESFSFYLYLSKKKKKKK